MKRLPALLPIVASWLVPPPAGAAEPRKIVIAHRGASGYLPEHTLEAVAVAHAMGADYLEQDVVLSKDGVPVVLHDIHLDTVTDVARRFPDRKREDGRYYAIDFSLAELKQLRVNERISLGSGKAVFPGRFPPGGASFEIPTLEEELQLVQGLNKSTGREAGVYPEIKEPAWHRKQGKDISLVVLDLLARYGYRTKADQVYVQCFDFDEVRRIRGELRYQGRLVQLIGETPDFAHLRTLAGLAEVAKVADGIGPGLAHVVSGRSGGAYQVTNLVRDAHAAGLVVHPYTFRADALPEYAGSLDELLRAFFDVAQVDGVFTDHPDKAVAFLRSGARP
jgi:glycerophosphoryl diester phosphodiesterase